MKVRVTLEISKELRRALNHSMGLPGYASRLDVKDWIKAIVDSTSDEICDELKKSEL